VTVAAGGDAEAWIGALAAELTWIRREGLLAPAPELDTLFVGGGTPSHLGPEAMGMLGRILGRERLAVPGLEWTGEANPESFTRLVAEGWAEAGVNRVSLGAQSFHDGALRWMGRLHGKEGTARAVEEARRAGIGNLSVDLLFGLPADVERDWDRDLEVALSLEVPHLSLYGLSVEEGTPLERDVREGRESPPEEERYRDEYLRAADVLSAAGYRHYEVGNFALPGFEARHNLACWRFRPYLGLGNSAHSYLPPIRRWNLRRWDAYQTSVQGGGSPLAGHEIVDGEAARLERIWMALRTAAGLPVDNLPPRARRTVELWKTRGWARSLEERDEAGRGPRRDGRGGGREKVRLTPEGWLLLDELALALDGALQTTEAVEPPRG
jgi:oxygen-independent coproporphyrinogen-3 oxidase